MRKIEKILLSCKKIIINIIYLIFEKDNEISHTNIRLSDELCR